jgi:hypothetical protein
MDERMDRLLYLQGELDETKGDLWRSGPQLFYGLVFGAVALVILGGDLVVEHGVTKYPAIAAGMSGTLGTALFVLGKRQGHFAGERAEWIIQETKKV